MMISRRLFFIKSGTLSSFWEETRLPPPQGFSQIQMWIVLEVTIDSTTTHKIIVAYYTSNHKLAIEIGPWMIIPISRDTRLCRFCFYYTVENETHFVFKCPLCNLLEISFHHYLLLFENVVPGSLKSFFQLNLQVEICLYLTEATALHHSRELICLKPDLLSIPLALPGLWNQFHFIPTPVTNQSCQSIRIHDGYESLI